MLIDDLTLIQPIGKGAFGEVYLTSKQGSKEKYATKRIEKKRFTGNPRAKKYLDNEIDILKDISHPNIVKLFDIKETSQYLYLVTEFCNGGGLSDCLEYYDEKYNKPFPENVVQYLMRQIVSALSYLHGKKILHRDIKLDNILVQFDNEEDRKNKNMLKATVKLIDFGFARYLKKEELAYSTLGSPINMDPGILRKLNKVEHSNEYGYDEKADIWSLGTICYEMLIGKCTFDADSMADLLRKVEEGDYLLPTTLSKEAVSFLNCMLQYDYKRRLSAQELSRHKFLNKNVKDFNQINLSKVKSKVKGENLKINSKINQSIWALFGGESIILDKIGSNGMINKNINYNIGGNLEEIKEEMEIIDKGSQQQNKPKIEKNPLINNTADTGNNIPDMKRKPSGKKLREKALEDEFMKVFDLINNDCIYIEPKLIPIIPGDDPAVINRTEYCDDN